MRREKKSEKGERKSNKKKGRTLIISEDNISNNNTKNYSEKISISDDSMFP
jgi:hypothetical protein